MLVIWLQDIRNQDQFSITTDSKKYRPNAVHRDIGNGDEKKQGSNMAKAKKAIKEEPLETQLWKAADKLRKNIDAAEYKGYVRVGS